MSRLLRALACAAIFTAPPAIIIGLMMLASGRVNTIPTIIALLMFAWFGAWTGYNWDRPDTFQLAERDKPRH